MRKVSWSKSIGLSLLLCGGLGACSEKAANPIVIRGSNTIGEELAPRLIADYKRTHPAVGFDLETKGTSYGTAALMVERCDIAAASRALSTNELALAKDRQLQFNQYPIGYYTVAVIVNPANPVTNLSQAQVREIFSGTIRNWKEVGGADATIQLFVRDPISGTHIGFQELAMDKMPYALTVKTATNYSGLARAVAADAHAIGYTGLDLAGESGVKAVAVGGIVASDAAARSGAYPYARALHLFTRQGGESPAARAFIDFIQSPAGQGIVKQMGFTPRL